VQNGNQESGLIQTVVLKLAYNVPSIAAVADLELQNLKLSTNEE
jgi:hypothetical protein